MNNAVCAKRILIIITTAFVPYGGLATVMMNYYRAMDKTGLMIDFASTNEPPQELLDELHRNGSEYYCLGNRNKQILRYHANLMRLLKEKRYDVVHVNGNSSTMVMELSAARKNGVPVRIAHGHTTKTKHPVINKLIAPAFKSCYNKAAAVSKDAGKWLFGSDFRVLNNAIDVQKYTYSESNRKKIRDEYNINDNIFVVGNVGKLNSPKNHEYLLCVFERIKRRIPNSKLLIVGGGELEGDLLRQCAELKLENDVIFTGMVDDTSEYIQAFDFFAFPSRFEGLGLALIEAQASGLKCLISDKVPTEAMVTNQVKAMGIDEKYDEWADYIATNSKYDRRMNAKRAEESIRVHGYDVVMEAEKLREMYIK